jgi:hypothetical protein
MMIALESEMEKRGKCGDGRKTGKGRGHDRPQGVK